MKSLKSLITTRPKASPETGESSNQGENASAQITVSEKGFEESKNANGSPLILAVALENVYQGFKERCRKDEIYQRRIKEPHIKEQEQQKTELLKRNTAKEIKESEVISLSEKVRQIEADIIEVKSNPEKYGIDANKKPKAQFYMGLLVLLPITIYLIVFYISASYSAFFKELDTTKIGEAIFDAQAFSKAWEAGWLEAVFVSTIPFTFMGLGYLVHMFQREGRKGIFKIIGLYLVTFIFDAILAYLIENKLYNFNKTPESGDFNLQIAFSSVSFWGIIFAGFVVYIIWGLVFDFVMKEFENIDKINSFIKGARLEKADLKKSISDLNDQIALIKNEIAQISGRIAELQTTINSFLFTRREYLLYHSSFLVGWLRAIAEVLHLPRSEKDILIEECTDRSNHHLKRYGLAESEGESEVLSIAV